MSEAEPKPVIVVSEDSAPNRKILITILAKMGFSVVETTDGAEAWNFFSTNTEHKIVALISDVMMPNMNGLDLIDKVRKMPQYENLPILVCTAVTEKDDIIRAKSYKVRGYLLKPIRADVLCKVLQEVFPGDDNLRRFAQSIQR